MKYSMGGKITTNIMAYKHRLLSMKRYKGRGRPRKSDYDLLTMADIQKIANKIRNKIAEAVFKENSK